MGARNKNTSQTSKRGKKRRQGTLGIWAFIVSAAIILIASAEASFRQKLFRTHGILAFVNEKEQWLTVKNEQDGKELLISWSGDTKLMLSSEGAEQKSFQVGDHVTISYRVSLLGTSYIVEAKVFDDGKH